MSVELAVIGISTLTVGGAYWYAQEIVKASKEIVDPLRSISSLEAPRQELQEDALLDIGTGQYAEEKLGNTLSDTKNMVLISGALNTTVFSIIRNYIPPKVLLRVIINKNLSKLMYIDRVRTSYSGEIRSTDKILTNDITIFFIDGKQTLLLRNKDNGVLIATSESAAITLAKKSSDLWFEATPL
jgi:hypothetical protein